MFKSMDKGDIDMPLVYIKGTTLNYWFDGPEQGAVVMLSHSLASNLTMWDAQVSALARAGYRILRYDTRGHGQSEVPPGPYSIELLAEDTVRLMDVLGLDKVHFCGLSMGGRVGQMLGIRHSDRLLSLAICSTSSDMPPRDVWDERIKMVRENGMKAVVDATIDRWFTKEGRERLSTEVKRVRNMILNTDPEGFCSCGAAIQNTDLHDAIASIPARTLVVVGDQDSGTPVSAAEFIHKQIAGSSFEVIQNAAHLVNIEQSIAFNRGLLDFLEAGR